jgi:hypothetical protein
MITKRSHRKGCGTEKETWPIVVKQSMENKSCKELSSVIRDQQILAREWFYKTQQK